MKVSVIMPLYNAAGSLQQSLDSLAAQSFRDFEVIFVDDGSTDGSLEMEGQFARTSGIECQCLRQGHLGVAAARNRGLEAARGEYLAFLDADDCMLPETLSVAVEMADTGVDIVGWDWLVEQGGKSREIRQPDYADAAGAVRCMMQGLMRWNLWLFLIRRDLVADNDIRFIEGCDMGEDMQFVIRAYMKAGRVARIARPLYKYRVGDDTSVSAVMTPRRREEVTGNLHALEKYLHGTEWEQYIPELKLFVKRPLLIGTDVDAYKTWYDWFPETNAVAIKGRELPMHTRLLQRMAAHRCWVGVKLYNILYKAAVSRKFK